MEAVRRALRIASNALEYSAIAAGTDCDPNADVVNATVAELIEMVRKGRPISEIETEVGKLLAGLSDLKVCMSAKRVGW
jgi:hypothetical protein